MKLSYRSIFIFIFLLFCVHGVKHIPFWSYWGLDFQNLFSYHHTCSGWPIPYFKSGSECGDPLGRPMVYPPLMYWCMFWVRLFDFKQGMLIWQILSVVFTVLGTYWVWFYEKGKNKLDWLVWLPILFCLPMAYALERANVDAWVVLLGGASLFFYFRNQFFISGLWMALATWMKVYPFIAIILVFLTLFLRKEFITLKKYGGGVVVGGLFFGVLTLPDSYHYTFNILPQFSKLGGGGGYASHVLYSGWLALLWKLPAVFLWVKWGIQKVKTDSLFVISGFLAISTFFQKTSNDYNLITAYPFLMLLISRAIRKTEQKSFFILVVFTLFVFVGDRSVYDLLGASRLHLQLFITWFFVFPWYFLSKKNTTNPI